PLRLGAFALPGAPLLALSVPPIVFLPPYYNQHLGIDLALISAIFIGARLLDIVLNPLIGALQDRTRTGFGRRRTWLVAATPVLMVAVWIAFIALPPGAPAFAVGLAVMGLYSSFAAMTIAHLGWAGEIRPDYHGRTRVLGAVQIASTIGQISVMTAPALVEHFGLGGLTEGVHAMGWTIIAFLPITVGICVAVVPEHPAPDSRAFDPFASWRALASSPSLRAILAPDFIIGVAQGVTGGLFLFYFQHQLGFANAASIILLALFLASMMGVPIWMALGRILGKRRALQLGCLWIAVMLAIAPILPHGNLPVALLAMGLAGLAYSAPTLLLRSMMGDVVDEEEVATGEQKSGLFYGLLLTTTKVGYALSLVTYALLDLAGFDAKLGAANSPEAMQALSWMFAGGPTLLYGLAIASLQFYRIDAGRQAVLKATLDARRANTQP
ncbi:MAG: MFS transporter, partial [Alphaproteobacteria bacterium]|nr:MFS transporter [Alphaproteobacteria bacterium]